MEYLKVKNVCTFEYASAGVSSMAHHVKNLLTVQETQVQSLCLEDPLEKEMATHYSILV